MPTKNGSVCILILIGLCWMRSGYTAPLPFSLDIDANGHYDALTDGLLITRHLLGLRGTDLIRGAVDLAGQRTDATTIESYLVAGMAALDVDCDGSVTPASDGLLILRRLFGFTGAPLVAGIATSLCSAATMEQRLNALAPLTAISRAVTIQQNSVYTGQLQALHLAEIPVTYTLITPPEQGSVTIDTPSTGRFSFTPKATATGMDQFVFAVHAPDQQATGTITLTFQPDTSHTTTNRFGMTFQSIRAGMFAMGSPSTETGRDGDEGPPHSINLSKNFQMQTTEVTQGQWQAIMGSNPARFSQCGPDCPVEQVSWEDVQQFIAKLNTQGEGIYRLPTESEWEYAARAGTTTPWAFGEQASLVDQYGWYDSNSLSSTHPVGQKWPNAWGLYDMHGNVWEWVADWYAPDYYSQSPATDPRGPASGTNRVARGGGWGTQPDHLRSAYRYNFVPEFFSSFLGFRLVRAVPP